MIILEKMQLFFTATLPAIRKRSKAENKMKNSRNKIAFPADHSCLLAKLIKKVTEKGEKKEVIPLSSRNNQQACQGRISVPDMP